MKSKKTIRSKNSKAFLWLALLLWVGTLLSGCASSASTEGGSSIPWNRPEKEDLSTSFFGGLGNNQ